MLFYVILTLLSALGGLCSMNVAILCAHYENMPI